MSSLSESTGMAVLQPEYSSLDEQAASYLIVGFAGAQLSDSLKRLIDRGIAGTILFSRNIQNLEQAAELIFTIKEYAGRPLVLSVDQEGGVVQRFREGFTRIPPMRTVGGQANPELAFKMGQLVGAELRALGIDLNYAPVLDVDTNPLNPVIGDRAFSRDPAQVAQLALAWARGLESSGVASCGKHFPGHGDTLQDSHRELPRLVHSFERLEAVELVPFQAYAEAGLASIMTAHIVFEAMDSLPATLSTRLIRGLLRERLGYSGIVLSDDLEMRAIADHFGFEEAAVLAAQADQDWILCCHTAETAHQMIDALAQALGSGSLEGEQQRARAQRVRSFLKRWVRPASRSVQQPQVDQELRASVGRLFGGSEPQGEDPTAYLEKWGRNKS